MEPLILKINSSLLREAFCLQKVHNKAVLGLRPRGASTSYKADYGNALHRGLKAIYSGASLEDVLSKTYDYFNAHVKPPPDSWYTVDHAMTSIGLYYFRFQKFDPLRPLFLDGKPLLERTFSQVFFESPRLVAILCGTIDFIGYYNLFGRDYLVVVDHKTTAFTDKKKFFKPYEVSAQGMLYVSQVRQLFPELEAAQFLVNGLFISKNNPIEIEKSTIIPFDKDILNNYLESVTETCQRIDRALETNKWPTNFNACAGKFNFLCEYLPLCKVSNLTQRADIATLSYDKQEYDPLAFQEEEE